MALYLGRDKVKINLDNVTYCVNLFIAFPTINDVVLSSSDSGILKDLNGLYLAPKESE